MKIITIVTTLLLSSACFAENTYNHYMDFDTNEVLIDHTKTEFKIINSDKKVLYENLNFAGYAGRSLQILNKDNEILYLNKDLKIIKDAEPERFSVCGSVQIYAYSINSHLLFYTISLEKGYEPIKTIETVPKGHINNITFLNGKKELWFDDNFKEPTTLLIELDDKTGVRELNSKHIEYFDKVDASDTSFIKVSKNNLWGYDKDKIKYTTLGSFTYNLAKFELPNGLQGYVDKQGKEYFK